MRRLAVIAATVVSLALLGMLLFLAVHTPTAHTPNNLANLTTAQLGDEKLRAEIRQLADNHAQAASAQQRLLAWAPFITALVAIVAVGATLWKQTTDLAAERQQAATDREKAREAEEQWRLSFAETQQVNRAQQESESQRRFDATVAGTITNLGSDSETVRVNAAAALSTYLSPRYSEFHQDLLTVVAANLQLKPSPALARILVRNLERLLRMVFDQAAAGDRPATLDLSRATLPRLDLTKLTLTPTVVDVAFADLREARLAGASLFRLRGMQVDLTKAYCSRAKLGEARLNKACLRGATLHEAVLVSATLKDADLSGAQLHEAQLQEAHLERADLRGADFTEANLANAYFAGAVFDEAALRSIALRAHNWRNNEHFDAAIKDTLLAIGGRGPDA